jgi:hypothetical protein
MRSLFLKSVEVSRGERRALSPNEIGRLQRPNATPRRSEDLAFGAARL